MTLLLPDNPLSSFSLPVPSLVGFLLCLFVLPAYIKFLRQKQIGQFIREEGPASHSQKASTPTMGGVCFIFSTAIACICWLWYCKALDAPALLVVAVAAGCGLVGLMDDLAKVQKKANAGVSGWLRLSLETILGLIVGILLLKTGPNPLQLLGPSGFTPHVQALTTVLNLPLPLYLLLCGFMMAATTNAVNLHDGMDGLAAGTSMQVMATMAIILTFTGQWTLASLAAAAAGSLAAFLIYNRHPAKIFMGDTGSLFVGGLMSAIAIAGRIELAFIPLSLIYIIETLSVMLQVAWFKLTKPYTGQEDISPLKLVWLKLTKRLPGEGKRFFRMAPLHHHFEAVGADHGIAEWQVVGCFWFAQFIVCLMVLLIFQ